MNQWKSASHETPPMQTLRWSERVIMQLNDGWIGIGIAWVDGGQKTWFYDDESPVDTEVLWWQPLPAPMPTKEEA